MIAMVNTLKGWVPRVVAITERFPWAIPLFGFGSGLASFFLVERKEEIAQFIAIMMLASWCWLTLEKVLRAYFARWFGVQLPPPVLSFFAQIVHQESLFFIIPFFFITTSWNSGQSVFTGLLLASAFVSIIDPLYFRWLAPRRWLYFCFHGITLFAVLLTALPIIFQLPTWKSYLLSLAIALAITLPSVAVEIPWRWWQRVLAVIALGAVASILALVLRSWVPPATLWLTEVAITQHIDGEKRAPKNSLKSITEQQLHAGLYAYTAIHAPRGLRERIYHVWTLNGKAIDKVALDINGGREAGYRAWSHKVNFPANALGHWQIHVVTEANQLIGILRFHVVESSGIATSADELLNSSAESSDIITSAPPTSATPDSLMKEQLLEMTGQNE